MDIPNLYAEEHYNFGGGNFDGSLDPKDAGAASRAGLIIAGSDGLSEEELVHALGIAKIMGAPEQELEALRNFDYRNANLDDFLTPGVRALAKVFLYDSIKVCSSDGPYSDAEREHIHKAAASLGVDDATVSAIESLVAAEHGLQELRFSLLGIAGNAKAANPLAS